MLIVLLFCAVAAPQAGARHEAAEQVLEGAAELLASQDASSALSRLEALARHSLSTDQHRSLLRLQHRALSELGRHREALELAERWQHEQPDPLAGEAVEARVATARSMLALDDVRGALGLLDAIADRLDELPDPQTIARARILYATALAGFAELAAADEQLDRVEAMLAGDDGDAGAQRQELIIAALSARAVVANYRGDRITALELGERATEIAEHISSRRLPALYINLAQSYMTLHDYANALLYLDRSATLESRPRGVRLASAGICRFELNDLDGAHASFEAARDLARERGNLAVEAWATGELGLVAWRRHDERAALDAFARAIEQSVAAGDRRNEVVWWQNRGMVYRDLGRYRQALEQYRQALERTREIPDLRVNPNLYKHMGQCYSGLGDDRQALPLFERALDEARPQGDTKVVWETLRELARLWARAGRREPATAAYLEALDTVESLRRGLRLESFKADFFEDKIQLYEEVVDHLVAGAEEDRFAAAFAVAERARARAFIDSLAESRARLDQTLPVEVRERERALLDRISLLQARERRGEPIDPEESVEPLEKQLDDLYLEVYARFPQFRAMRTVAAARLEQVQAALRPEEALLELFLGEHGSHLWLLRRERAEYRALPPRGEIDALVRRAYTELLDPSHTPTSPAELARVLLAPLVEKLDGIESLIVVPSGSLFYFPLEVLPSGDGVPVVERWRTSYLPSATTLLELRASRRPSASPALLAVGDPVAGAGTARPTRGGDLRGLAELGALPYARREVRAVARRFPGSARLMLGADATEARLKAEPLDRYSVVHFATHGVIDPSAPSSSGLVLAAEPGGEDGLLQPREILRLHLQADLITLSTCQSALGELVTGEGMVSLARSFFYAGTQSVVASLWNVDDRAGAELMDRFYRQLASGADKASALRLARLQVRSLPGRSHPYYWAPFLLLGEGADQVAIPEPVSASPAVTAVAALLAALTAMAGILRHRRR